MECLFRKYKGTVNNNNLAFLGYKKIYVESVSEASNKSNGLTFYSSMKVDGKIKVNGNNLYFADSSLVSSGSKELSNNPTNFFWTNNDGVILISPLTTQIFSVASAASIVKSYYLKLDEYYDVTTLEKIVIQKSVKSEGDIISLAANIDLTNFVIPNCILITGDLVEFAIEQIDKYSRTSGTLTITSNGNLKIGTVATTTNNSNYVINYVSSTEFNVVTNSSSVTYTYRKVDNVWTLIE